MLEVLDVCIKIRELRGKGSYCPIFNVDGYRRLSGITMSRPPFRGQLQGLVLTSEIHSISRCALLFKVWPTSLIPNLINFNTIKSHEEKHPH